MARTAPYIHALKGRLRVNIAGVKGSPIRALDVEDRLGRLNGIRRVSANPVTGNVLIFYHDSAISQHDLLETLRTLGMVHPTHSDVMRLGHNEHPVLATLIAQSVARTTVELAVQGLIRALI